MRISFICVAALVFALLGSFAYKTVQADPLLPLPRVPVGGDQDDPSDPPRFNDPAFVHLPEVQVFTVPGAGQSEITFDFVFRGASMNNEFGFFRVDNASGAIDGMLPGEAGYLSAAWQRAQVVFPSGATASTPDKAVSLAGGDSLAFFLVADATLASLLNDNPQNLPNLGPHAFFSIDMLNPDDGDHFVGFRNKVDGITQFGFEDLYGGGDQDFDDIVYNMNAYLQPLPSPIARNVVFVRGLDSEGDCDQADQWLGEYFASSEFQDTFGNVAIGSLLHFNYKGGGTYTCPTTATAYAPVDTCDGITTAASELKGAINQGATAKVAIIAHGTGGAVAAYLVASDAEWAQAHIAAVVTLDSPLKGIANPQEWASMLGSLCITNPGPMPASSTLAELQDTGDVMVAAGDAANLIPFYALDATRDDAPAFESVPRERARLSNSRAFRTQNICGTAGAPGEPDCEPPLPVDDNYAEVWARRFDAQTTDKAPLVACAVLNRTDCTTTAVPIPPGGQPGTDVMTSTVTVRAGVALIRFTASFTGTVRMRIIAPDGTVYGPNGEGPIAGYEITDSVEVYEIANPMPGEWNIVFTNLDPSGGDVIVNLTVVVQEVDEPERMLPPKAVLDDNIAGYALQAIVLSAIESVDNDGTIVKYEWDVDNDGKFEYHWCQLKQVAG